MISQFFTDPYPSTGTPMNIFISGRLANKPVFLKTQKDKDMARIALDCEFVREVRRGEWQAEQHTLPIVLFSWLVDQIRDVAPGSVVLISCHLSGTSYQPPDGSPAKLGVQLVGDRLWLPPPRKETAAP
jgi:single-stranded DNA-binding protein